MKTLSFRLKGHLDTALRRDLTEHLRGRADRGMTTDDVLLLTRGDTP